MAEARLVPQFAKVLRKVDKVDRVDRVDKVDNEIVMRIMM